MQSTGVKELKNEQEMTWKSGHLEGSGRSWPNLREQCVQKHRDGGGGQGTYQWRQDKKSPGLAYRGSMMGF